MTMPNPLGQTSCGQGSIRSGLCRITSDGPMHAGLVRPGDELVLWVEVHAGDRPRTLTVEFWRGERLRDRWEQRLDRGVAVARVFRLHRSGAAMSSRLICRLLVDGREVARQTALVAPAPADSQGRFAEGSAPPPASAATLLAFVEELACIVDHGAL
jgi:hypothetical protein